MLNIAIVVVTYNRADSVQRLLESLKVAHYSKEVTIIISIDKSESDEVSNIADAYEWIFGPKIVIKHETNLGLRNHILSIGSYTLKYDAIIVLEDDLIVSPGFFEFAYQAIHKYNDIEEIAGISLYSFNTNHQNYLPFVPTNNGYDAFLFQNAQSWGQVWTKNKWQDFIKWYENNNEEFGEASHLPSTICNWGKKSWLKYHIKYCIENNKYFVYPYISLTFNSGAAGTHSKAVNRSPHCPLLWGVKYNYNFPNVADAVKYDAFYERIGIEEFLNIDDLCVDLYGFKQNKCKQRYWLTTEIRPYKVIATFALLYHPIEANIFQKAEGDGIYLYDTDYSSENPFNNVVNLANFYYKFDGLFRFFRVRGLFNSLFQMSRYFLSKFL